MMARNVAVRMNCQCNREAVRVPEIPLATRSPRILFIRLSALGDVVNSLHALAALRAAMPGAHIAFVVEDRARELVEGHPHVDEAIVFERRRWAAELLQPWRWPKLAGDFISHVRRLRRVKADVALDFQGNLKGALHSRLSGAPVRLGFARGHCYEGAQRMATHAVEPPGLRIPRAEKFKSLLRPLGVDDGAARAVVPEPPRSVEAVREFLSREGLREGGYVVIHPCTSRFGAQKQWELARFAQVGDWVVEHLGLDVVLTWGPGEEDAAREVARRMKRAHVAPKTSILDLAALIRRARLFIGSDTGPLHLAGAVGTRCVGLYGPKDPAIYGPYPADSHVLVGATASDGAFAPETMAAITVEQVTRAVAEAVR